MTDIVVSSGVTNSGLTVSGGDTITVLSGGTALDSSVLRGGEVVLAGGVARGTTISGGTATLSGGTAVDLTITQGGNAFAYVAPNAITSAACVTPQCCTSESCGAIFDTSPTNFAFFYGGSLNDAVDFPAGAFTTPGLYTALAVGGRLIVAPLTDEFEAPSPGTPMPEPETWSTMLLALGAMGIVLRRRGAIHPASPAPTTD